MPSRPISIRSPTLFHSFHLTFLTFKSYRQTQARSPALRNYDRMKARILEWVHTRHFTSNLASRVCWSLTSSPSSSRSRPFFPWCSHTQPHCTLGRNKQGVHHVYTCVHANYTLSTLLLSQRTSICYFPAAVRNSSRRATHTTSSS